MVTYIQEICLDGEKNTAFNLLEGFLLTVNRTIDSVFHR